MANTKLNVYKIVLQEVCEKFSEAEKYIKKRIVMKNYQQKR